MIYEMLYNIADNAIRYTNQNGTVNIFTGTINGHAFYRVEDNGIGIPENEQKRIFERFYRVDKSHSRATGGTGLGLSIVKHGAILHNAEIKLESEPGKGTKMELVFLAHRLLFFFGGSYNQMSISDRAASSAIIVQSGWKLGESIPVPVELQVPETTFF